MFSFLQYVYSVGQALFGCTKLLARLRYVVALTLLLNQVVYESQPWPDVSLYLAPLGGEAADAVMTLNAQAGK